MEFIKSILNNSLDVNCARSIFCLVFIFLTSSVYLSLFWIKKNPYCELLGISSILVIICGIILQIIINHAGIMVNIFNLKCLFVGMLILYTSLLIILDLMLDGIKIRKTIPLFILCTCLLIPFLIVSNILE